MSRNGNGFKYRLIHHILIKNGFTLGKCKGSHQKYYKNNRMLVVSVNGVNEMLWKRLCQEHNINTDV